MIFKSLRTFIIISLLLVACANPYRFVLSTPERISVNEKLNFSVSEKNNTAIDSVHFYIDGKRLASNQDVNIATMRLGKHALSATVFYENQQKQLTNTITFLAANEPDIYDFELINEYPHDEKAFTQGLEYHNGYLYESTGQYGASSLRKVALETGEIVKRIDLKPSYFAEGITIVGDKIIQLTWKAKKGFVYNLEDFSVEKEFYYGASEEGWGLAHDSERLIKTDGSERVWFLNSADQKEMGFVEVYTHDRMVDKLNEIEFINGKIFANKWQQNSILIIDPNNGAIEGIANLKGLQAKAGQKGSDNVLNGIAYDSQNERLFVTGKNWNKLFEIKLKKRQ